MTTKDGSDNESDKMSEEDKQLAGEALTPRVDVWTRRRTRRVLMQGLYQWQMTGADAAQIEQNLAASGSLKRVDQSYFQELLGAILRDSETLDELFSPLLDRKLKDLDKVELAILRLATFELSQRLDIPYRVVIDEAVQLARKFGAEDSHKYVNGVLDGLARALRPAEVTAHGRI